MMPGVDFASSTLEAVGGADAIVLVTEWPEFAQLDWNAVASATAGRVVIDGRNFVDAEQVRAAGFTYEGIGR
jgi:UDPglucose 6-dehydrogenase